MALVNMKLSPEQAKEMDCCAPASDGGPAYPWGLALYLDDETLAKLGISQLPDVGSRLTLTAIVEVTSNSQRQTQEGKTVNMDLQITDMELSGTRAEPSAASVLYGGGGSE
jgi:hypothetical protein